MTRDVDQDRIDAGTSAEIEPDGQERYAVDRYEALGHTIGQRPQPFAETSCQKKRLHRITEPVLSSSWTPARSRATSATTLSIPAADSVEARKQGCLANSLDGGLIAHRPHETSRWLG